MTSNDFRRLAVSFPEAAERAQMNHPDFRVTAAAENWAISAA